MFKQEGSVAVRAIAALIGAVALAASLAGVVFPDIYVPVIHASESPFLFAQDLTSAAASALLLAVLRANGVKADILRTGLVAYLFYAYAQYAMGTLYSILYFAFLAVFGLSIFYFILAFTAIDYDRLEIRMPGVLRVVLALYCAAIAVYFAPQWVAAIWRSIQAKAWPAEFDMIRYVYVLDMCFVLPVCVIASVLLFRKKLLGAVLGGVLSVLGFTLMLSVAIGFVCPPLFGQAMAVGDAIQFSVIALIFLLLSICYGAFVKGRPAQSSARA